MPSAKTERSFPAVRNLPLREPHPRHCWWRCLHLRRVNGCNVIDAVADIRDGFSFQLHGPDDPFLLMWFDLCKTSMSTRWPLALRANMLWSILPVITLGSAMPKLPGNVSGGKPVITRTIFTIHAFFQSVDRFQRTALQRIFQQD